MGYPEAQYVIDELKKNITNIPAWINDYKIWGKDSYVFNIPEILDAVYMSREGVNDPIINTDGIIYANSKGGAAFNTWLHNIESTKDQADTLYNGILTIDNLLVNETAMLSMFNDNAAKQIFLNAVDWYEKFLNSKAYMDYVATNAEFNALLNKASKSNKKYIIDVFRTLGTSMTSESFTAASVNKKQTTILPDINNTYYIIDSIYGYNNNGATAAPTLYVKENIENDFDTYGFYNPAYSGATTPNNDIKICKSLDVYTNWAASFYTFEIRYHKLTIN